MDNHNLYEYAVIRFVPDVERAEFVNVGLVMMCKRRRWLRVDLRVDEERIRAFFGVSDADMAGLQAQLQSFVLIAEGRGVSPLAQLPVEERFRWLTAVRSACLQTSRPHPGLTEDLDATFTRLLTRYL